MTERSQIVLFDRHKATTAPAEFIDGVTEAEVHAAQALWEGPLKDSGAQHSHWDWRKKYQWLKNAPLAYHVFGIKAEEQMQGLLLVQKVGKVCRIETQKNKELIYVDYLSSAPWKSSDTCPKPRFAGIGRILIRAAIMLSVEEEFKGRIGLHSLPQADTFYRDICGMTDLGPDEDYQNLRYFEATAEQTAIFLRG
jgi:hypothetical protein